MAGMAALRFHPGPRLVQATLATHHGNLKQAEIRASCRPVDPTTDRAGSETGAPGHASPMRLELLIFAVILAIVNAPLPGGDWSSQFAFLPELVARGQWWRVITHPFAHVSWYHLLLDGAAFLMLHAELREWSSWRRLAAIGASALGSLMAALTSPVICSNGFGGLSGVAHGLMAISAVEMIRGAAPWERWIGWCSLVLVVAKAGFEASTGIVALKFLHFGMLGLPVAACHAGGVIGGLAFYLLLRPASR